MRRIQQNPTLMELAVKHFLFSDKRFMRSLCPSGCGLFQFVFSTLSPMYCAVLLADAWEINDAVQNLSSPPGHDPYQKPPLHLYCNDLSFFETAGICNSYARLINGVYTSCRQAAKLSQMNHAAIVLLQIPRQISTFDGMPVREAGS